MMDKNIVFILTILESIEKIKIYTHHFNDADEFYSSDDQLQFNAVLKLLSVIGEECNKIDSGLMQDSEKIDWRAIKDMRNRIVHDYRGIDQHIVFSIVNENLDMLKIELIEIFKKISKSISMEELEEILQSEFYRHLHFLIDLK
jgi:uncharacterized protein with HEPN domain